MQEAANLDRPNKEKICDFIINLSNNGGKQQQAALDAGYGNASTDEGRNVAGATAARLLRDVRISELYEKLKNLKFSSEIFTKSFTKDHIVAIYYQLGMKLVDKNPAKAIVAWKEAATLSGFYEDEARTMAVKAMEKAETTEQLLLTAQKLFDKHPGVV